MGFNLPPERSEKIRKVLLPVALLFVALLLALAWTFLTGSLLRQVWTVIALEGFLILFLGIIFSGDWLGEKDDYGRTVYVGWGRVSVYPRQNLGPKLSERQAQAVKSARITANLLGLLFILTGVILLVLSASLAVIV